MQTSSCAENTPSLDDVVHRATLANTDGSTSSTPHCTHRTCISQLTDEDSPLAAELAHTPTAHALQKLCRGFVEQYRTPDALLLDTAWWASESQRLREGSAVPARILPTSSTGPARADKEELVRRATQLLRATHASTAVADGTAELLGTSLQSRRATGPLPQLNPPIEPSETNVLLLLDDPVSAQEGNWESLDFASAEVKRRMGKDEECLLVLDAWAAARGNPSLISSDNAELEATRLASLEYVLRHRPELVTRHEELFELQRAVACSACQTPTERWTQAASALFQALPARAQLDFLHGVLSSLSELGPSREQDGDVRRMTFVRQLLLELAENWLPLLDSEVTDLFVRVVREVVLPYSTVLDGVDPEATWLSVWCLRPSMVLSLDTLVKDHAGVLQDVCASFAESPHRTSVLLHLFPLLSEPCEGKRSEVVVDDEGTGDTSRGGGCGGGGDDSSVTISTSTTTPLWVHLFCDLQQVLSDPAITIFPPGVYEVGACALRSCVSRLPPNAKLHCFGALTDSLLLSWQPSSAGAAAQLSCTFSLQLLTELMDSDAAAPSAQWCEPSMWELIDGPLRSHFAAAVTDAASLQLSPETVALIQDSWCHLVSNHADKLPQSINAVVEDVVDQADAAAAAAADAAHPALTSSDAPFHLFTWQALVAVSATVSGWVALQAHLPHLSSHPPSTTRVYGALFKSILQFCDASPFFPSSHAPSVTKTTKRKASKSASAAHSKKYSPISSFSPACVALLLRWSTYPTAHHEFQQLTRAATLHYRRGVQRVRDADAEAGHDSPPLLLWPIEAYSQPGMADLSYAENTSATTRMAQSLACYQSLSLLLSCAALPVGGDVPVHAPAITDTVRAIYQQLDTQWMRSEDQNIRTTEGGEGDARRGEEEEERKGAIASTTVNHSPFEEESLLVLLSALAVCLLVHASAEYAAWFRPDALSHHIRPLRELCVSRRGVDPAYFMVRYLTSGKGRKRLPAILLDGCAADLTVDTVVDLSDFVEGEDMPTGDLATPVEGAVVEELLRAAFHSSSFFSPSATNSAVQPTQEGSGGGSTPRCWSASVQRLALTLLTHQTALRTSPTALQQLFSSRSPAEWEAFADHRTRAAAVAQFMEANSPAAVAALRGAAVDVVYLCALCVSNWLWLPETHTTSARRRLGWAAVQYVSSFGVEAWDAHVARSLASHVERLQRESTAAVNTAVVFPHMRPLPLPSPLFVLLLVKPFALAAL